MELKPSDIELDDRPIAPRARWVLNRSAFAALLSSLDPDEVRGAEKYERLRQRLIIFFSSRRAPDPEESADDTLDRVRRRIDEGEPVRDVTQFAYGVARLVLSESLKRVRRRRRLLTALATSVAPPRWDHASSTFRSDGAAECIRRCTNCLPEEDRRLILQYYDSGGKDRQQERKALAARLAVSPVALRLRAHRIRRVLEACTRKCLASRTAGRS